MVLIKHPLELLMCKYLGKPFFETFSIRYVGAFITII